MRAIGNARSASEFLNGSLPPATSFLHPDTPNISTHKRVIPRIRTTLRHMTSSNNRDAGIADIPDLTDEVSFQNEFPEFTGPYSLVYKGTYRGENVAIKALNVLVSKNLSAMKRKFKREIIVSAHVDHPNIIPLYGYTEGIGRFGRIGALISPWCPNGDAEKYLKERGSSLSMKERVRMWKGVVSGVCYLHEQDPRIVHGDLKPKNILIDNEGQARVCDFGLAYILKENGSTGLTTTSPYTGTERYMAPELLLEEQPRPSTASDVWALGCIGLQFIFSLIPYQNRIDNRAGLIYQDIRSGILPGFQPNHLDINVLDIWHILANCWSMLPNERVDVQTILYLLRPIDWQVVDTWRETAHVVNDSLTGHTHWVNSVAFSPDGTLVVSGSRDKTAQLWDVETMQAVGKPFKDHRGRVASVAFSPDGTCIASGSADKTVKIWDAATGVVLTTCNGHTGAVLSVAFSPDGDFIASGSSDKTVRLWDARTGQALGLPFNGHGDWVRAVSFSPDGTRIASGSKDNTVRIWDAVADQVLGMSFTQHQSVVYSVAFSPDGTQIASASADKTVRIWDATTGQARGAPFSGHTDGVNSVAFSPDGTCIASGSYDHTVRIWDVATGQMARNPLIDMYSIQSVAFSPDGTYIASGSSNSVVRLWRVHNTEP